MDMSKRWTVYSRMEFGPIEGDAKYYMDLLPQNVRPGLGFMEVPYEYRTGDLQRSFDIEREISSEHRENGFTIAIVKPNLDLTEFWGGRERWETIKSRLFMVLCDSPLNFWIGSTLSDQAWSVMNLDGATLAKLVKWLNKLKNVEILSERGIVLVAQVDLRSLPEWDELVKITEAKKIKVDQAVWGQEDQSTVLGQMITLLRQRVESDHPDDAEK